MNKNIIVLDLANGHHKIVRIDLITLDELDKLDIINWRYRKVGINAKRSA